MAKYVIGVDGGGTKTHYALFDSSGKLTNFIQGGPANHEICPDGYKGASKEIKGTIFKLLQQSRLKPEDISYSIFGLAGADTKKQQKELSKIISETGIKNFKFFNDAFLGIKAGSDKGYGICSINGTGTCCVGIDKNDEWLQIGGTGWTFGDEAALELLRHSGREMAKSVIGVIKRLNFSGEKEIDIILAGSINLKGENPELINAFKKEVYFREKRKMCFIPLQVPPVAGAVIWAIEKLNKNKNPNIRKRVLQEFKNTL